MSENDSQNTINGATLSEKWKCPHCGTINEKGALRQTYEDRCKRGEDIAGDSSCLSCYKGTPKREVFGGKHDASDDPEVAPPQKSPSEPHSEQAAHGSPGVLEGEGIHSRHRRQLEFGTPPSEEAYMAWKKVLTEEPLNIEAFNGVVEYFTSKREGDKLTELLSKQITHLKALKSPSQMQLSHLYHLIIKLAAVFEELIEKTSKAAELLTEATESYPLYPGFWWPYGRLKACLGDDEIAVTRFREIAQLIKGEAAMEAELLAAQGGVHCEAGELDEAMSCFAEVARLGYPSLVPPVVLDVSHISENDEDFTFVFELLKRTTAIVPHEVSLWDVLVRASTRAGCEKKAIPLFTGIASTENNDVIQDLALLQVARLYCRMNEMQKAKKTLKPLKKRGFSSCVYYDILAEINLEEGKYDAAKKALKKGFAQARTPQEHVVFAAKLRALSQDFLDDAKEARRWFKEESKYDLDEVDSLY